MRAAKSVGGAALLVALLLGAPGCATASPIVEAPVPSAGLEPATAGAASGGLQQTCGQFMSLPSGGEMLALGVLLLPVVVVVSPFLLVYAVVGTPLRVLTRRS